jgi:hypothetical protein
LNTLRLLGRESPSAIWVVPPGNVEVTPAEFS